MINKCRFLNRIHFFSGIFRNYLIFTPAEKYIKYFSDTTWIKLQKPNGMSEENIENITKIDSNFADHHLLPDLIFNEHCLIKNNIYIPKKVINLYIS